MFRLQQSRRLFKIYKYFKFKFQYVQITTSKNELTQQEFLDLNFNMFRLQQNFFEVKKMNRLNLNFNMFRLQLHHLSLNLYTK